MLTQANPKLPMRNRQATQDYYCGQLGFERFGQADHAAYLMVQRDAVQLHFFLHEGLDPLENYGQVYLRTDAIHTLYEDLVRRGVSIHPAGALALKPWGQWEFSLLDPDHNLLTFGQEA